MLVLQFLLNQLVVVGNQTLNLWCEDQLACFMLNLQTSCDWEPYQQNSPKDQVATTMVDGEHKDIVFELSEISYVILVQQLRQRVPLCNNLMDLFDFLKKIFWAVSAVNAFITIIEINFFFYFFFTYLNVSLLY